MSPEPQSQSIGGIFVPRLVARLHREGFEGTLRLHSGGATRVVYFRRGDIASAASNAETDRLHNILIREGRLTEPQVEMARSRQRPGASLGKVLIELGFLTPSELLQGARRQVRQILASCFALGEGTWQSVPGPLGPEVTNLGLPVRRLIFDALMEAGDRSAIVREMGSMESVYAPAEALPEALHTLRLEPAMEEVARMIDGAATLREISSRTRLDDFTVSRIVLALDILGLAVMTSHPEPAVAARPGRRIPVEGTDEGPGSDVAILPAESPAPSEPSAPQAAAAQDEAAPAALPQFAASPAPAAAAGPMYTGPVETAPAANPPAPPPAMAQAPAPMPDDTVRIPAPFFPSPPRPEEDREIPLPAAAESAALDEPPRGAASTTEATAGIDTHSTAPPRGEEPPPFPHDELPAFATPPREEPPRWEVNPDTGEKIHEGPIELTFDGPVAPDRAAKSSTRFVLGAGLAVVVVLALAVSFFMRSRTGEGAPEFDEPGIATAPAESAADRPADGTAEPPGAGAPGEGEPAAIPAAGTPSGAATADAGTTAAPSEPAPTAEAPATAPQESPAAALEQPAGEPAPAEPAPRPAPAAVAPARGAGDLAAGQALLDAGDVAGAEAAFRDALADLPADRLTLQLLIACEAATVLKARAAIDPADPLFVTPFVMQGRSCHRLLWGTYPDRATARSAGETLPPYFAEAGVKPVIISIGRLRGPS